MGQHSKIDWCDATWNPVTGCLHGCEYCYARKIANRFAGEDGNGSIHELDKRMFVRHRNDDGEWNKEYECAYPYNFDPTLHRYRLDEPQKWKKPKTIFVCSMADLFGEWVPDEWIKEVFTACENAMQHRYMFLTKNPKRLLKLAREERLPDYSNFWYGTTITKPEQQFFFQTPFFTNEHRSNSYGIFVSIEPIQKDFSVQERFSMMPGKQQNCIDWMIVGAETGNRKNKTIPKREWIEHLITTSEKTGIPLFMKESLREIMGDDFKQELPWEVSD